MPTPNRRNRRTRYLVRVAQKRVGATLAVARDRRSGDKGDRKGRPYARKKNGRAVKHARLYLGLPPVREKSKKE